MNHASDLRIKTLCGLILKKLPKSDRAYAALTKDTRKLVNCPMCKEQLRKSF